MGMIPYRITTDRNDYKVYGFVFVSDYEKEKIYNVDIVVEEQLSEDDSGELKVKSKIVDIKCQCYSHRYNDIKCKHVERAIKYLRENSK